MSLLNTASPWNNEDNTPKKRTPSMINTYKTTIQSISPNEDAIPNNIASSQEIHQQRGSRVNELLNKMNISLDNDGSKLANFNPPPQPILNQRKPDVTGKTATNELNPKELLPQNVLNPIPVHSNEKGNMPTKMGTDMSNGVNYSANDSNLGMLSNYNNIYNGNMTPISVPNHATPYYSKMGISNAASSSSGSMGSIDTKLLEKLNYMIHLLEEQQNEKTSNITEEFILYTFLGVFIIYIVDSFAKSGKYVR
jgi:hypothetical protein